MTTSQCACGRAARHRGEFCHACYERLRRRGELEYLPSRSAEERFFEKVEKVSSGCWVWQGALSPQNYGRFNRGGRGHTVYAHRWSYEHLRGPIPDGLTLDHLCRVTTCVNPDHLEPVTQGENNRRSVVARGLDEACAKGHPRSEAYVHLGKRQCRGCRRDRWRTRALDPAFRAEHAAYERARKARRHPIHDMPESTVEQREYERRKVGER